MESEPTRPGRTFFIVEDDPLVRAHAAIIFEDLGYPVVACDTAESALTAIEQDPGRALGLFTDVSLAGEASGLLLARRVFARWPWIHILVASGQVLPQEEDLPPMARFIAKPWIAEDVLVALALDEGV